MNKMRKNLLTCGFSLAMAAAICRNASYSRCSKSSRRERSLNSPFFRRMIFMVIWMTLSRWMMEPYITIRLRSMLPSLKDVRNEEENVFLTDGGDVFLRGEFQAGQGELETSLLKALDYDVMVLGNNDFRVYPAGEGTPDSRYEQLKDYHRNVNFPILTGNVIDKETGKYIQNVKPWTSFTFKGVKVGVIGLTSMKPEIRGWNDVADLDFIEPVETLEGVAS